MTSTVPLLPPPVLLAMAALAILGLDAVLPTLRWAIPPIAAWSVAGCGGALMAWAVVSILSHGTTIDPRRPEATRHLIETGPFAWSRNPIYLADALLLVALVLWVGNPAGLLAVLLFVIAIHRRQIPAEETALAERFGARFEAYRRRVRRWL
jgi:protein-S-isoprenylcysteine O-methyltransferase Ste14